MTTSVQVSEKTLQLLLRLKKELRARSLDQVIHDLIFERKKIPRSMFGSNPSSDRFLPRKRLSRTSSRHVIDTYARSIELVESRSLTVVRRSFFSFSLLGKVQTGYPY